MSKDENRCWPGYEPVKGKPAHSQGSCKPKAESKSTPSEKKFKAARRKQLDKWEAEHKNTRPSASQHLDAPKAAKKKTATKKTEAKRKSPAKKAPTQKSITRKATAKKATTKKSAAAKTKRTSARKSASRRSTTKRTTATRKRAQAR